MNDRVAVRNAHFGEVAIETEDLALLAETMGMAPEDCVRRLEGYHPREMAEAWRRRNPRTPAEIRAFYGASDLYIWELLVWNATPLYERLYLQPVRELAARWAPDASSSARALEYGAGIGTAARELAAAGFAVTVADIPGPTFDFAQARLDRHGVRFEVREILTDEPELPERAWDAVSCLDVIEHVPYPDRLARALVRATKPGGGLALKADFASDDDDFPHHLAETRARFSGARWERLLRGEGLRPVATHLYRRGPRALGVPWRLRARLAGMVRR